MIISIKSKDNITCQSFPKLPEVMVNRDNILDTIERMFDSDIDIVFIEGDDGIGKTTLLAQFSLRHPETSIAIFVRPASRFGYDFSTIKYDLCCQLTHIIAPNRSCEPEQATDGYLQSMFLRLRKLAKRKRLYFIIDGLSDIPDEATRLLIIHSLPIGQGLPFLVSGDPMLISEGTRKLLKYRSCPVVTFSLDETIKYFSDLELERSIIEELYKACKKGIPAYLASVRRSIQSGSKPEQLVKAKIADLFEEEWNKFSENELAISIMSLVAFAQHKPIVTDISRILKLNSLEVERITINISFLDIDKLTTEISYVSLQFADFAKKKLYEKKNLVFDMIIEDLISRETSETAMIHLPIYLEQRGKLNEVIGFLSPDYFNRIIQQKESLTPVYQKISLGINTASKTQNDGVLLRFIMQNCVLNEMEGSQIWRSEIEALVALNEPIKALVLAQNAPLREDRLHLLAVVAKSIKEKGQIIDEDLINQLKLLYKQIDVKFLGDRAIDIAADLFYSCPEIALDIVECATPNEGGENALDFAYTKLTLATLNSSHTDSGHADRLGTIRERIKNPRLRSFTSTISVITKNQSAKEVLVEVKKIESTDDRLYILRQWIVDHKDNEDVTEVIDFALQITIGTTAYAPNAAVYREIASPLPFLSDKQKLKEFIGIFDSQKTTIEEVGPTEDYIRLQLLIARALFILDSEMCWNRLVEVYFEIASIKDFSTQVSCFAWLLAAIKKIDKDGTFDERDKIADLTLNDIDNSITLLLKDTAEQSLFSNQIISALVSVDQEKSFMIAYRMNTTLRRDKAYMTFIEALLTLSLNKIDFSLLKKALEHIFDSEIRDDGIIQILEYFANYKKEDDLVISSSLQFIEYIDKILFASKKCRAFCLAHSIFNRCDSSQKYITLLNKLELDLDKTWIEIDIIWLKIDTGFRIAKAFANYNEKLGLEYLRRTDEIRVNTIFSSMSSSLAYNGSLRLSIRSYIGLLIGNHEQSNDYSRLEYLIEQIPSKSERAEIWGEMAINYFLAEKSDKAKQIVNQYIFPVLKDMPNYDKGPFIETIIAIAPALYLTHAPSAYELFHSLPSAQSEEAFIESAIYLLRKKSPSDAYDQQDTGYNIDYNTIIDIINLINEIRTDSSILNLIASIADTLSSSKFKNHFTSQQKVEIIRKLRQICHAKFPDPLNIKHDGYIIAANAHIARIDNTRPVEWQDLIKLARNIPNSADSSFVLSIIAKAMPKREHDRCIVVFNEAMSLTDKIPCSFDQLNRLADIAAIIINTDTQLAKACLQKANAIITKNEESVIYSAKKRIIDIAYKIDPDFASSLASLTDKDPARIYYKLKMKQRLETLKLKKTLIQARDSDNISIRENKTELPQSAWMALGSLNAGKTSTVHFENTRKPLTLAANYPLSEAYPILAWVIENAVQRLSRTDQAPITLRQIFEATVVSSEIALANAKIISKKIHSDSSAIQLLSQESNFLISAGQRDKAINYLQDWLINESKNYIKICDQYFDPNDLDLLVMLQSFSPNCYIYILTSQKPHNDKNILIPQTEYPQQWLRISDQDPPKVEIVIVGQDNSGMSPIHDRYWITDGAGLKIGTSWNSLGRSQSSSILSLSQTEAAIVEKEIDTYLINKKREYNGVKLKYQTVVL